MDKIVSSAIEYEGKVYTGLRHHQIIHKIYKSNGGRHVVGEQGFMTEAGKFVNRTEALSIAIAANQLVRKTSPKDILFSEDLW